MKILSNILSAVVAFARRVVLSVSHISPLKIFAKIRDENSLEKLDKLEYAKISFVG